MKWLALFLACMAFIPLESPTSERGIKEPARLTCEKLGRDIKPRVNFLTGFKGDPTYTSLKVIADFEDGIDEWDNSMSATKKKPKIESVEDAKAGKKGAKITYFAAAKSTDWTLLKCDFDEWPVEGDTLSFWMKSPTDKTHVQVKLSEMGGDHKDHEGYHKEIEVGTEWKQYRIPLSEFEYLWSMNPESTKTLDKDKLSNIAFAQPDVTKEMVIFVDQIEIMKSEDKKTQK